MEPTARRNSGHHRLIDRPMVTLYDQIAGVGFSLWIPAGARRSAGAASEIALALDADGDTLELIVVLVRRPEHRTMEHQVTYLESLGDEIHRASSLVDGYLVTSIGNVDLNVVRHLRQDDVALQCWATVRRRTDSLAARILWAESMCSSLAAHRAIS